MSTNNLLPSTSAGGFSTVGNIAGNVFIGNGSQLTGVVASAGNTIVNGTSNVTIATANANVSINVGEAAYIFDDTGNLQLVNGFVIGASGGDADITTNNSLNIYAQNGIELFTTGGDYAWNFDANGNLTFPQGSVYTGNTFVSPLSSGALNNFAWKFSDTTAGTDTVTLQWNLLDTTFDQWLLTTGGQAKSWTLDSSTQQLSFGNVGDPVVSALTFGTATNSGVGNVNAIELTSTNSNVYVRANNYSWMFGANGTLTVPYEGIIQSLDDTVILQSKDTGTGNIYSARLGTNGGLYFASTEYPTGWLDITNNAGNANITSPINSGGAAGHNLNLTAGAADTAVYNANVGGNLNLVGGTGGFNDDGVGGPGGDVNITSGAPGEAGGLAGNVYVNAGTAAWTFNNNSQLKVANLTISASNGIGASASIFEDNGDLQVLASGTNGVVNVGWAENALTAGNTSVMWFNEPGNVGNAVIRTGNTAADSFAWIFDNAGNLTIPNAILAQGVSSPSPVIRGFEFVGSLTGNVSTTGVVITPSLSGVGNIAISTGNVANSTISFNVNGATFGSLGDGVALGYGAGNGLGNIANAIQTSGIAIGTTAGQTNQGLHSIAVGWNTGTFTQGNSAVAIGENAAWVTQGDFAVALGAVAGRESQSANAVAIGTRAGLSSQGGRSVAIGTDAGNTSQGADSVAIGTTAGLDTQGTNSVAIGKYAGNTNQGSSSVAVGASAGQSAQGVNSVAVGVAAAERGQGNAATALGWNAGQITQGNLAIAVGSGAAYNEQGYAAIAIGADTSPINQGQYSIAIGAGASTGNIQANNSIIIDATGTGTTPAAAAGFYVNPVRNDAANVGNVVTYNTVTKELTYTNTISVAGNVYGTNVTTKQTGSWTLAAGVNTANITVPANGTYSMWVNGNIPNGIIVWNATVTVTNTNVPVIGSQYAWYYAAGNALVLTSIPAQIIGTNGVIGNATGSGTTNNVFEFNITNNSGNSQVVNWGYITL